MDNRGLAGLEGTKRTVGTVTTYWAAYVAKKGWRMLILRSAARQPSLLAA